MYAVKLTNLTTIPNRNFFVPARDWADACDKQRHEIKEFDDMEWIRGEDYEIEIVEVDADFDFDNQEDFN